MKILVSIACAALFSAGTFAAEQPGVQIGVVQLRLGEAKDEVLARLSPYYDVSDQGFVSEKQHAGNILGTIGFQKNRLTLALRDWSPDDQQQAYAYAHALIGAIRQLVSEGHQSCTLQVAANQTPEGENQAAAIICGSKRLAIGTTVYKGASSGTLQEVIGEFQQTRPN